MKVYGKISSALLMCSLIFGCGTEERLNLDQVVKEFNSHADRIKKVQYSITVIDTFPDGATEIKKGMAVIQKDPDDEILGFSFFAKQETGQFTNEYVYDNGNGFELSRKDSSYRMEKGSIGFLGSSGGQMVHKNC